MLRGVITALVTPFKENGEIDFASLDNLIEFQINNGVVGLVIGGTTGEGSNFSNEEKETLILHAIKQINNRIKVVVGLSDIGTLSAQNSIIKLNKIKGIDYVLALTPAYVKPTQEGLYKHFMAIADASDYPIILYNVPARTNCNLNDDTVIKLAMSSNKIIGLKDATGNVGRCIYMVKHRPQNFMLYSGDDETSLAFNLCGGDGTISVVSNLLPKEICQVINYAMSGDAIKAMKANAGLVEINSALFMETNPIPVKWALFYSKLIQSPTLRLPLTTLSKESQTKLSNILDGFYNKGYKE